VFVREVEEGGGGDVRRLIEFTRSRYPLVASHPDAMRSIVAALAVCADEGSVPRP
jgi:hypothetical protein